MKLVKIYKEEDRKNRSGLELRRHTRLHLQSILQLQGLVVAGLSIA
ncbi:hypothetical protein [Bradyrhizobium sp. CCBAU 51753]|nr:hypothetical protein [Bradyrhizobium sp. CCBAU 51753]